MIQISVLKENSCFKELKVSGHSLQGDYGHNIICAGVSVLTISILNGLTEVCKIKDLKIQSSEGFIKLEIGNHLTKSQENDLNLLLETLIFSYRQLKQEYPNEINFEIKEN